MVRSLEHSQSIFASVLMTTVSVSTGIVTSINRRHQLHLELARFYWT